MHYINGYGIRDFERLSLSQQDSVRDAIVTWGFLLEARKIFTPKTLADDIEETSTYPESDSVVQTLRSM